MDRYRPTPITGPDDPRLLFVRGQLTDAELVERAGISEAVRIFARMEFGVPFRPDTNSN